MEKNDKKILKKICIVCICIILLILIVQIINSKNNVRDFREEWNDIIENAESNNIINQENISMKINVALSGSVENVSSPLELSEEDYNNFKTLFNKLPNAMQIFKETNTIMQNADKLTIQIVTMSFNESMEDIRYFINLKDSDNNTYYVLINTKEIELTSNNVMQPNIYLLYACAQDGSIIYGEAGSQVLGASIVIAGSGRYVIKSEENKELFSDVINYIIQ
jgi:hypothetical protein